MSACGLTKVFIQARFVAYWCKLKTIRLNAIGIVWVYSRQGYRWIAHTGSAPPPNKGFSYMPLPLTKPHFRVELFAA